MLHVFLNSDTVFFFSKGLEYAEQVGLIHYYHVCYEGCLTNFEIGNDAAEASELYPEIKYTTVEEYMKRYL